MDVTLTGTAVVNLFLLHLEWTVRSNDIINPSIYNSADNVVICVLGLWGGCLGHEGHQQFPWSSGVHPFSSHRLAYVQFLQTVIPGALSLGHHLLPHCFSKQGEGSWPYLWGREAIWSSRIFIRCNLSAPFSIRPRLTSEPSACSQQRMCSKCHINPMSAC